MLNAERGGRLLVAIVLTLLMPASAVASVPLSIRVRDKAACSGGYVRLGEVAELEGDADEVARAAGVLLGIAPAPGEERLIAATYLRVRLGHAGLDGATLHFADARGVQVARSGDGTAGKDDKSGADAWLEAALERAFPGVECEARDTVIADFDGEAVGLASLELLADSLQFEGGALRCLARGPGPDRTLIRRPLSARVGFFRYAAIATRPVALNRELVPGDVRPARMPVARPDEPGLGPEAVLGRMTRTALEAGMMLRPEHLKQPIVVKRNTRVLVELHRGALTVRADALAGEDGGIGDEIKLKLVRGSEEFLAVVTGPGRATVRGWDGGRP